MLLIFIVINQILRFIQVLMDFLSNNNNNKTLVNNNTKLLCWYFKLRNAQLWTQTTYSTTRVSDRISQRYDIIYFNKILTRRGSRVTSMLCHLYLFMELTVKNPICVVSRRSYTRTLISGQHVGIKVVDRVYNLTSSVLLQFLASRSYCKC